jgi:hypothetical protein
MLLNHQPSLDVVFIQPYFNILDMVRYPKISVDMKLQLSIVEWFRTGSLEDGVRGLA